MIRSEETRTTVKYHSEVPNRMFHVFDEYGDPMGEPIEAYQISQEGNAVGFYAQSVDGNSRRLVAYVVLGIGYSVRELK